MPKGIEDEQKIKEKKDVSLTEHGGQVGALTRKERVRNVVCLCAPKSGVKLRRCNKRFSLKHELNLTLGLWLLR